jgi:hypothetical protein
MVLNDLHFSDSIFDALLRWCVVGMWPSVEMCGERRPGVERVERCGMQGAVPWEEKPFLGLVGRRGSVE